MQSTLSKHENNILYGKKNRLKFTYTDRHFYLTSEIIRYQGGENDRKVFEPSSPVLTCVFLRQ